MPDSSFPDGLVTAHLVGFVFSALEEKGAIIGDIDNPSRFQRLISKPGEAETRCHYRFPASKIGMLASVGT